MRDAYAVYVLTEFEINIKGIYTGLYHREYGLEEVFLFWLKQTDYYLKL